jgi:glyoxylase-like metal-dependent hydrolase (beta-lactamase superfamily II)
MARAGAAPGDVDAIVVTHAHFDHLGNVAAFPNATVYIQRREVEKWSWAVSLPRSMDWLKQGVSLDDLATLLRLAGEGRLRLVDGPAEDVFPGVSLVPDFDTHTYGHQHVVIRTASSGVWVVPGDVMFLYANIEGIGGDGRYVPIGLAMGSQENCMLALDELMRVTGGETSRILPGHEKLLWDRHPSHRYPDGLHMAEVCLRPGDPSLLPHGDHARRAAGDLR